MKAMRYIPDTNGKRDNDGAPAGWYEVVYVNKGRLESSAWWWNGSQWNHRPNMNRGWKRLSEVYRDDEIKGIHRLAVAD